MSNLTLTVINAVFTSREAATIDRDLYIAMARLNLGLSPNIRYAGVALMTKLFRSMPEA